MLVNFEIPRCMFQDSGDILHCALHGFGDAFSKGYCAVVYIVYTTKTGTFSQLVCSKSRVAPLKKLTIPRLELLAVRVLANLIGQIARLSYFGSITVRNGNSLCSIG